MVIIRYYLIRVRLDGRRSRYCSLGAKIKLYLLNFRTWQLTREVTHFNWAKRWTNLPFWKKNDLYGRFNLTPNDIVWSLLNISSEILLNDVNSLRLAFSRRLTKRRQIFVIQHVARFNQNDSYDIMIIYRISLGPIRLMMLTIVLSGLFHVFKCIINVDFVVVMMR